MSKVRLCCIFNYAPLYRKSIYKKIDNEFDAQFCFDDTESDIVKMEYEDFEKKPITLRLRHILGTPLNWRFGVIPLVFRRYKHYLVIGDANLSYLLFLPLCHILRKKVYAWGHGYKDFNGKMGWYHRWLANHFDKFFIYGEGGKKRMVKLGVSDSKIEVIYNSLNEGVNPDDQISYKSDLLSDHFGNNFPILLFVGRLTTVKQLDWIIKAQAYHKAKSLNYNMLFIGDGTEKEKLQELVKVHNLENRVWFYGPCYNDDELSSLLYNVDLCVSPGNVGLTALHAMTYGTPVISNNDFETQMPEYEIIVPGKTGLLYKKGDFEDFCDKIETWLSANIDRDEVRNNCYNMINNNYNARYQIELLKSIIK